ncbi:hypothetical protein Adt_44260 [Abeliophyllum distichum]|uniref:Uncharacterized protein n=1 Tax=Abeliophyllum distichum TaxID=126358 RepID=A0ABD1PAF5_9LAMI
MGKAQPPEVTIPMINCSRFSPLPKRHAAGNPVGLGTLQVPLPQGLDTLHVPLPQGLGTLQVPLPQGLGTLPVPLPQGLGTIQVPLPQSLDTHPASPNVTPHACSGTPVHLIYDIQGPTPT